MVSGQAAKRFQNLGVEDSTLDKAVSIKSRVNVILTEERHLHSIAFLELEEPA